MVYYDKKFAAEKKQKIKAYAAQLERGRWYILRELYAACCADMPWVSACCFRRYLCEALDNAGIKYGTARKQIFTGKQEKCIFLLK